MTTPRDDTTSSGFLAEMVAIIRDRDGNIVQREGWPVIADPAKVERQLEALRIYRRTGDPTAAIREGLFPEDAATR